MRSALVAFAVGTAAGVSGLVSGTTAANATSVPYTTLDLSIEMMDYGFAVVEDGPTAGERSITGQIEDNLNAIPDPTGWGFESELLYDFGTGHWSGNGPSGTDFWLADVNGQRFLEGTFLGFMGEGGSSWGPEGTYYFGTLLNVMNPEFDNGFAVRFENEPLVDFGQTSSFVQVEDEFPIEYYFGTVRINPLQPAPIPLPAGLPLLLAGLGAFAVLRRRSRA